MSKIKEYFGEYSGDRDKFDLFHNEVMNMPRDEFGSSGFKKIQTLASYLLLIEDDVNTDGDNYKLYLGYMINKVENGILPEEKFRDTTLEERYLNLNNQTLDEHYDNVGRMFRHLMGICAFFDLITSISRQKKIINFETCRILTKSDDEILIPVFRNILMNININNNDYIKSLKVIELDEGADYKPASSILKYINKLNRPATLFEVSILLGRVDKLKTDNEILKRALEIGTELPISFDDQKRKFFTELEWINEEHSFDYASSQEPDFKFRNFILYMKDLSLVKFNEITKTIELTEISLKLVNESVIPEELIDLENLINKVKDESTKDSELLNLIVKKRSKQLTYALSEENSELLKNINLRAIKNVEYDSVGKRKRNKFIAELAKLKAGYLCQVTGKATFRMPNGDNYVEAHHLIEFSRENGPDIVENLLILGPEKHRLVHHACSEEIDDLYNHLKMSGVITFDLFKRMIIDYGCLDDEHLRILKNKKLLSTVQYDELIELIQLDAL